ncbi:MAG: hypothetical protein KBD50_03410 [Candidatus Pacebacteria bacterium]|nr:hypothetical protein [Candidatus Paceibacterota bacterium]
MDPALEQKISARMAELPDNVRQAIVSSDLEKKIQTIGGKHRLHLDQMGKLEDETLLVMLGFAEPDEFATNLASQIGIAQSEAQAIAEDLGNEVFLPIRQSMQDFLEESSLLETLSEATKDVIPPASGVGSPTVPVAPKPAPVPPVPSAPAPQSHPSDMMLSQKTVTVPPAPANTPAAPPQKPTNYKADPYREPPEV